MTTPALTIWYDASCPLCATEMRALQRHAGVDVLDLRDCSAADFDGTDVVAAGYAQADLMRLIHARDANGRWLRGVEVFERAYRLAGIDRVARVFENRRLRPLWDRLYPWIARNRMLLSRLHLNAIYGWVIDRAARRAEVRMRACVDNRCVR
jgi:predicted DCC family thiol-disulfide oxidoreductase YuxK